jgi:hypothetical protein
MLKKEAAGWEGPAAEKKVLFIWDGIEYFVLQVVDQNTIVKKINHI